MASPTYAIVGEFDDPETLVEAAAKARAEGYRKVEAYTPFPVHGLSDALEVTDSNVFIITFIGGVLGFLGGCALQAFTSAVDYPMNIGGRPYYSWVSFIPPAYELTILFASIGAVVGMLAMNGLPLPYHPVFNVPAFARASQDKFFLAIEAADPKFDAVSTQQFLSSLHARQVVHIDH
jgi:hypothetical protein